MSEIKTILLNRSVYQDNDEEADKLREYLRAHKCFVVNVMSSPGSGKTTTLINLINELKSELRIGIMEADIDSTIDAVKVAKETGCKSIQLHTGGMCHLDAGMTKRGLDELDISDLDLVFLENVGNLVCPAEFDTGASMDMSILSVPEGDDKPLKYPLMYEKSSLVIINKIDTLPFFDFDIEKCKNRILKLNPNAKIICISAKTRENISEVKNYFLKLVRR